MSMSSTITGPRRVKVWQADAEWPDDTYVVPAEDYDLVTTDRDIKAANLQLLVEKVLAASELYDLLQSDEDNAVTGIFSRSTKDVITKGKEALDLARSLKQ